MTEQGVLEPIQFAGVGARRDQPPVVQADATLRQAAEEAARMGHRSFVVASDDQLYAIDVHDLASWAFNAAEGEGRTRVANQIKLLKRLYTSEQPLLEALKAERFVPTALQESPRLRSRAGILNLPDDVRDQADTIDRLAIGFNRIYVCESGLHTWSGYSSPPERCPKGKPYKLQSLDE